MTVDLHQGNIILAGKCAVEETETLVGLLENHPGVAVDMAAATEIHTALWQALLVYRPQIVRAPQSSSIAGLVFRISAEVEKASKT